MIVIKPAALALAMIAVPGVGAPLDGDRWKKRIILIFSTAGNFGIIDAMPMRRSEANRS